METLLWLAAKERDVNLIKFFLDRKVNINAYCGNFTPLYAAAASDNVDNVKFLLDQGADVNKGHKKNIDFTPLYAAVKCGSANAVELLLKAQPVDDEKLVLLAVKNGHLEVIKKLLPNDRKTPAGPQLLFTAARNGYLEIVDYLVQERDVDVNTCITNSFSALYVAANNGREDVVTYLIKHGANINKLENGSTVLFSLMFGKEDKLYKIVSLLLEKGADVNAKASHGFTPLHIAAISGKSKMFQLLCDNGADMNALTEDKLTPRDFVSHPDILAYLKEKEENIEK
ncbi:hypothetical protein Trydic_g19981 [Trypoxylus dichotomus]